MKRRHPGYEPNESQQSIKLNCDQKFMTTYEDSNSNKTQISIKLVILYPKLCVFNDNW